MKLMLQIFVLFGAAIIWCESAAARENRVVWKIDQSTAKRLAAEAVYGTDEYLNSYDFDSKTDAFIVFNTSSAPAEGGFGFFAVNLWTGDVWALWGCHRLSTPALRKSQAAIRRQFPPAEMKRYARLHQLKPLCVVED